MMESKGIPKERPKARKQIENLISKGKTLTDIFQESEDEKFKPRHERQYTIDMRKQAFRMEIEAIQGKKLSMIKKGWIEVSDGSLVHPNDKDTLRKYGQV